MDLCNVKEEEEEENRKLTGLELCTESYCCSQSHCPYYKVLAYKK